MDLRTLTTFALTIGLLGGLAGCDDGSDDGGEATADAAAPDTDSPDTAPGPDATVDAASPDMTAPLDMAADVLPDARPDLGADAEPDAAPDMAPAPCEPACPGRQTCEAGACVEPAACSEDLDCLDGRHCRIALDGTGACADDCFEDAACPGTRLCALDTGRCPEASPCLAPDDCDPGRACVDGACADLCGPQNPCPGGQTCDPDGRCAEPAECAADADCLGDRLCLFGACADRCREDADCPGTRMCDPVSGRCPEPAACFAEGDCDPGRLCDAGECADACGGDDDCPGRQRCGPAGLCVEPVACEADLDCRGARLCLDAACTDPCREDADCPGALSCLPDGRCGEAPQGCARDADCLGDRICLDALCADPECDENAECPDGSCVDRRCAPAPVECIADADCPGLACAPLGVCAASGPCRLDGDCGGLRPICLRGACAACATDLDCTQSELCIDGACVFLDGCGGDADCPGRRQCAMASCLPSPCLGDASDAIDPDDFATPTLAARTYRGLVLCDGDTDRYRVELAAGEGIEVITRHDPAAGDLTVRLTAAGAPDAIYATADGIGVDVVGLAPSPAPRAVDVEVTGRVGYDPTYDLTLTRLATCPRDPHEGPFGNDTLATATPIGPAPLTVELCPGDTDHLAFDALAGTALTVTATPDQLVDVLVIDLLDPAGDVIASARPQDRVFALTADLPADGRYTVRLESGPDPLRVDLALATAPAADAAARACAAVPPLASDTPLALPQTLPVDRLEPACAAGFRAPDHVAAFRLDRAATVEFIVRPDDRQTTIAVRGACADPAPEVACEFAAEAGPLDLEPGDYTVIVESSGVVPQTLELRTR